MSDAFKCDDCGTLEEGTPRRLRLSHQTRMSVGLLTDGKTLAKGEFCDDCADDVEAAFKDALAGDSDDTGGDSDE